jgi:hypothetical protein
MVEMVEGRVTGTLEHSGVLGASALLFKFSSLSLRVLLGAGNPFPTTRGCCCVFGWAVRWILHLSRQLWTPMAKVSGIWGGKKKTRVRN